jgi:hypothetical protein
MQKVSETPSQPIVRHGGMYLSPQDWWEVVIRDCSSRSVWAKMFGRFSFLLQNLRAGKLNRHFLREVNTSGGGRKSGKGVMW